MGRTNVVRFKCGECPNATYNEDDFVPEGWSELGWNFCLSFHMQSNNRGVFGPDENAECFCSPKCAAKGATKMVEQLAEKVRKFAEDVAEGDPGGRKS